MFHYRENIVHADSLPRSGFLRLSSIIAPAGPLPIGRSTWWRGVKSGRFPKPIKLGPNTTVWKADDIQSLIDAFSCERPSK